MPHRKPQKYLSNKPSSKLKKFYIIAGIFIVFCILFTICLNICSSTINKQDEELNENIQKMEEELKENINNYNQSTNLAG